MAMKKCQHCQVKDATRPRRLCWGCYENREIRGLYARGTPGAVRPGSFNQKGVSQEREMTAAEIDAMVAEQYANLPPWWKDESEKLRKNVRGNAEFRRMPQMNRKRKRKV